MKRIMVMLMVVTIFVGGLAGCGQTETIPTDMEMIEEICNYEGYTRVSDIKMEKHLTVFGDEDNELNDYYSFEVVDSEGNRQEVSYQKAALKYIIGLCQVNTEN